MGLTPLLPFLLGIGGSPGAIFGTKRRGDRRGISGVGIARGLVLDQPVVRAGLETLVIGGVTAALSYAVGVALQSVGAA